MEVNTAIALLTITVILLSIVIVTVIIVGIVVLIKVNTLIHNINDVTVRVKRAAEWLSPEKVFDKLFRVIRKMRS